MAMRPNGKAGQTHGDGADGRGRTDDLLVGNEVFCLLNYIRKILPTGPGNAGDVLGRRFSRLKQGRCAIQRDQVLKEQEWS